MERYKILTQQSLTEELYLQTWKLDNETFEEKDQISKQMALDFFYNSGKSTIVLFDTQENKLIGYISPFLLNHNFCSNYIISNKNYKEALKKPVFFDFDKDKKEGDIYIFSTVVVKEYRDKVLPETNKNSQFFNKSAFKVLNEALVDWICEIKNKGVSINYILAEQVNDDGKKYLKSLGLQPCFALADDVKCAKLFTPQSFQKCSNVKKLYDLYSNKDLCVPFDKNILDNHNYLSIKNNVLYYKDLNLLELVEKYKAPLEVGYTPMITERVNYLKNLFAQKIKENNYPNKYNYAYATKANYYSEVVLTAFNSCDMLETSSAYDIDIIVKLVEKNIIKPGYTIICNGYKNEKYISSITKLLDAGINVVPIIENEQEFDLLSKLTTYNINVGIRYNSDFESRLIKNNFAKDEEFDNRFGFDKADALEIASKISKAKNLTLKVLHFHFGGTISNIDNYIKGFSNIFNFYCELKKKHPSLEYFDFGGGFPIKYSLTYSFDYDYLVDSMVKAAKTLSVNNGIDAPQLIGEHGRFTTADHSFYIYKIDFTKESNNTNWYIINGSLMNMTPDMWGIQQDFTILPVNLLNNKCIPVCLGGETCDPDDRYFLQDENVKLFMPEIKKGETLYIAIFSIGAYQEIISGIGGVHHCLIPEGNELVIYKKDNEYKYIITGQATDSKHALDILDYDDNNYMQNFIEKKDRK